MGGITISNMANIANIQKLSYCGCKLGNNSKCGNIATHSVKLCKRGIDVNGVILSTMYDTRCEIHKEKGTVSMKVFEVKEYDQSCSIQMVNNFLKTLIGKLIKSSVHTARELEVKFIKDNCAVMCYQNNSKKWKFVYYDQIKQIVG